MKVLFFLDESTVRLEYVKYIFVPVSKEVLATPRKQRGCGFHEIADYCYKTI